MTSFGCQAGGRSCVSNTSGLIPAYMIFQSSVALCASHSTSTGRRFLGCRRWVLALCPRRCVLAAIGAWERQGQNQRCTTAPLPTVRRCYLRVRVRLRPIVLRWHFGGHASVYDSAYDCRDSQRFRLPEVQPTNDIPVAAGSPPATEQEHICPYWRLLTINIAPCLTL